MNFIYFRGSFPLTQRIKLGCFFQHQADQVFMEWFGLIWMTKIGDFVTETGVP